jgi:hypothetical protein
MPLKQVPVSYNVAGEYWILLEDFTYEDGNYKVTVPKGFKFDLASIPRLFWRLTAPHELGLAGPLVHDYLYRHGGYVPSGNFSRSDADWIFFNIMREARVPAWRRWIAYIAVRLFGERAFGP